MPDRRGTRFAVEVVFLAALATALAFARLGALEIVGMMALGWVVVAGLEWAAWRGEPHYGSGLPPRYYVPGVRLPPPQPLEQVQQGYPDSSRDEAPTWIASAALRSELLGEWPVAAPAAAEESDEFEEEDEDPWSVAEFPAAPLGEEIVEVSRADEAEAEAVDQAEEAEADEEPDAAPAADQAVPAARRPILAGKTAWYTLDPLGDVPRRRRFRRGDQLPERPGVEVEALPVRNRALPGSLAARPAGEANRKD